MSDLNQFEKIKLKRLIRELKNKEGRGTELITLYIPSERQISDIMNVLRDEYSQAGNIKDRTTRHHVQEALTSIMQRLKFFNKAPKNGLIIFAGYVSSDIPGKEEFEIHLIEPPYPISNYLYRCDSRFHVEILEEMLKSEKKYGLVTIDREEAAFAILQGSYLEILEVITSGIPGKHRAGGQSARRFERIIEIIAHEFYKRIGERMVKYFLQDNIVEGIIIGGPGPTKHTFLDGDYIPNNLKSKIIGVYDLSYSGEEGIYELLERSKEDLKTVDLIKQKNEINEFLKLLTENPKQTIVGLKEVLREVDKGNISKVLIMEDLGIYRIKYKCLNCGAESEILTTNYENQNLVCSNCNSTAVKISDKKEETHQIIDKIVENGGEAIFLNVNLNESEFIKRNFGGIIGYTKY